MLNNCELLKEIRKLLTNKSISTILSSRNECAAKSRGMRSEIADESGSTGKTKNISRWMFPYNRSALFARQGLWWGGDSPCNTWGVAWGVGRVNTLVCFGGAHARTLGNQPNSTFLKQAVQAWSVLIVNGWGSIEIGLCKHLHFEWIELDGA